ncbi:hypothetical protein [Pseudomonas fluorescens]|uniref:hypothetical protein n=1 Tax=Pseudomonas fluorescens TaxID=294 RepID=UPI000B006550|nr:hypothetical protein [Pseudomonas fluorescens]
MTLFYAIPEPIRKRVRLDRREHWIEKYRDVFTKARYQYEKDAGSGSSDILIGILDELIDDVVDWYRELGCKDLFIVCYGMPPLEQLSDSDLESECDLRYFWTQPAGHAIQGLQHLSLLSGHIF